MPVAHELRGIGTNMQNHYVARVSYPIVTASAKVLEESATPDMQCTFAPGSFKGGQI